MERIGNRRMEDFPPCALYLDDLAQIISIIAGACERVEITAGDYKIGDVKELNDLAGKFPDDRFKAVSIVGRTPYVTVDLNAYGVRAYISEDSLEQRGIIARVTDVINHNKKGNPMGPYQVMLILGGAAAVLIFFQGMYLLAALVAAATYSLSSVAVDKAMKESVVIYTHNQRATKSFWERKKDDIAVAGIGGLVGAILGCLATILVQKYLK